MTDKKKKYLAPEITVIEIEQADIIATSTQAEFSPYSTDDTTFNGGW